MIRAGHLLPALLICCAAPAAAGPVLPSFAGAAAPAAAAEDRLRESDDVPAPPVTALFAAAMAILGWRMGRKR